MGFKVQDNMISDVQKAIFESDIPIFLNIRAEACAIAIKGNPMAKYAVGTHVAG
jgi:hypothetical protein